MSQHDLDIANQGFPATRADLNNALQALGSTNSGATAPSTTYANQLWYDTANNILKIRNEDNDAWISVLYLDQTNDAVTQFDVDNIRIDGNTISSTDTNGDITLDPNGTGKTLIAGGDDNYFFGVKGSTYGLRYNSNATSTQMMIEAVDDTLAASHEPLFVGGSTVSLGIAGSTKLHIDASGVVGVGLIPSGTEKLQVSGQIKASQDGSVSAPAFVLNDGNTGFYRPSNNCIGFTTDGTERMRVDNGGKLTLATGGSNITAGGGTPQFSMNFSASVGPGLTIQDTTATNGNAFVRFVNAGTYAGQISSNGGTSMTYGSASDYRLKENVEDMTGAITRVKSLQPRRFSWIADDLDAANFDGFLAHEAQAVVPEAVTGTHNEVETWTQAEIDAGDAPDNTSAGDNKLDDDGNTMPLMQGIDHSKLVPLLTGALQEAIAKIESLETRVAALEA